MGQLVNDEFYKTVGMIFDDNHMDEIIKDSNQFLRSTLESYKEKAQRSSENYDKVSDDAEKVCFEALRIQSTLLFPNVEESAVRAAHLQMCNLFDGDVEWKRVMLKRIDTPRAEEQYSGQLRRQGNPRFELCSTHNLGSGDFSRRSHILGVWSQECADFSWSCHICQKH